MPLCPKAKPKLQGGAPDIALVVGHATWWNPLATRKKMRLAFAVALQDFMQNFSFHCYGRIMEHGRRYVEKVFWLIFHIIALIVLLVFLLRTHNIDGQLLATTIFDPLYPVQKVAFPAVSICSLNRISNASANKFAVELSRKDPMQRGADFFYNEIKMMKYNYYTLDDNNDFDRVLRFQTYLDTFDTEDFELFHNTRRRMKMLTPSCRDILVKCRLGGEDFDCFDEFRETLTQRGFCCTFNHDGRYAKERTMKRRFFGPEKGLIVYLNSSKEDYFYSMTKVEGFLISIYAVGNYPEMFSGGVRERHAQTGFDTYFSVTPKILETVSQAKFLLSPRSRNCFFADEMPRIFGKGYTFNKCITRCRIRSILVLCECILFYAPYEYLDASTDTVFCTLQHKECLERYQFKWLNVITQRQNVRGLEREMEDALYCPDCLPSCSETVYQLSVMGLPLNNYTNSVLHLPSEAMTPNTNLALMRVYFGSPHIEYLQQIIKSEWFEVFSTIGSICGIITGFSLIGICEVLFFFGKHLVMAYNDFILSEHKEKNGAITAPPLLILP